jgi:ABC-2 type transport system ATP-binding protein
MSVPGLLEVVDFDASPGSITAILGPNGAGKTTLLEAMVGLRPSSGSVEVSGKRMATFADRARAFAYMPDEIVPPLEATVDLVVREALRHRPVENLADLRAALDLGAILERPMGLLSRGERKRVELFCAIALDRPAHVLDEPFDAFDPLQLRRVHEAVRATAARGSAVVVSVHQLAEAERIADRFLLLAGGKRVAFGDLASLRSLSGESSLEDIFVALLEHAAA